MIATHQFITITLKWLEVIHNIEISKSQSFHTVIEDNRLPKMLSNGSVLIKSWNQTGTDDYYI